ncbi:3-hexulose-6-phosphate synthase [Lentibacillus sediminis]|uniref:3-hexulose-6-phosphate synthase n=1 Tax=Lentibacillus sediminis TaxID=1940529 RepID=UPI000C1BF261|nr:3-hexulose-6-phosphate synthase [Lentibacillus sediminis]
MKLQLALDRLTREQCIQLTNETSESIDIIEVGTGVIKEYGMPIVREIRQLYSDKLILADMKTCDAGAHEAKQAFEAGADITTVMAFSSEATILDTLQVADNYKKRIMIDLLGVTSREKIAWLKKLNVDLVSLHIGKDQQQSGAKFDTSVFSLVKNVDMEVAVAGGIGIDTLPDVITEKPDIVIAGSAITKSQNPRETAAKMKKQIKQQD